jgi:hypothetical protein
MLSYAVQVQEIFQDGWHEGQDDTQGHRDWYPEGSCSTGGAVAPEKENWRGCRRIGEYLHGGSWRLIRSLVDSIDMRPDLVVPGPTLDVT